jgi:predicted nucleic-acid-binding protein
MRAVDTNVLVRFFTKDDLRKYSEVERLLDACDRRQEQVFVSIPVLCELVWVLSIRYRQTKHQIEPILVGMLEDPLFKMEQESSVRTALDRYRTGKGNFADYLIGAIGVDAGCRDIVTFDRDLRGIPGFTILP